MSDLVAEADNIFPSVVGDRAGGGTSWSKAVGAGNCVRDGGGDSVHVIDWLTNRPSAGTHVEVFDELDTLGDKRGDGEVHVPAVRAERAGGVSSGWVKPIEGTADRCGRGMIIGAVHGDRPPLNGSGGGVLRDGLGSAFSPPRESTSGVLVGTTSARDFPRRCRHSAQG